jgi:hypothetical protein
MKRGFTLFEGMVVFAAVAILALLFLPFVLCLFPSGCDPSYSDGDRVGVVTKLSHRGLSMKSWEGQLNVGSTSTDGNGVAVPTTWAFSVEDEAVVQRLKEVAQTGQRATLHYHQYLVKPWRFDTEYVIDSVDVEKPDGTNKSLRH